MKRIILTCGFILVSACASNGVISKSMAIQPGMSRADVVEVLGAPQNRSFKEDAEALQYCTTGAMSDQYVNVWLVDGEVIALTNYTDETGFLCSGDMREIDWGQAPADIRIAIE